MKRFLRRVLPDSAFERLRYIYFLLRDAPQVAGFLARSHPVATFSQKLRLVMQFLKIDRHVDCPHTMSEILHFVDLILATPPGRRGDFIECGAFKGGSTAKFSLACKLAGRRLIVCDSFEGIPENDEDAHVTLDGKSVLFPKGSYRGGLDEVKGNIRSHGALEVCEFVKGYFDDTLPGRDDILAGVYLDVDLASSTRTCIIHLWPRIVDGGWLMSQDGHLRLVLAEFKDPGLWQDILGQKVPDPLGFGTDKLIRLRKA